MAATPLRIDFVSDIACPWCAIGLASLRQALDALGDAVDAEIHMQPFELNPQMASEGEDANEHLARKYALTPEQVAQNREQIRQRGADVGFVFGTEKRTRIRNTFDAHRLLHWAEGSGRQLALKQALLKACFTDGEDVSSHAVLARLAADAGLDADEARAILGSERYAGDVRAQEQRYLDRGIHSVPATIVNDHYLIPGGQTPAFFEAALRRVASKVSPRG